MAADKRRVLITGATGLVGSALQRVGPSYPELELICVSSKDADLRDKKAVRALLQKHAPLDSIIHCAVNNGGVLKHLEQPVTMLEDTLLMNTNIVKEAHAADVPNVMMVLSTCIFPDEVAASGKEMTSDDLHMGAPHSANEGFAHAKRLSEVQCRAYQRQYGRRYFSVTPTNVYGPNDCFDLKNAHVIGALIHKAHLAAKSGSDFVVGGDGTPLRQFIYADDLAHLMFRTLLSYQDIATARILCPPDAEVSIGHVAETIADAFGIRHLFKYDTSMPNGQARKTVRPTDEPGMVYTPIEEGLRRSIQWFQENSPYAK